MTTEAIGLPRTTEASRATWFLATVVGAGIGLAYVLSPGAIWFAVLAVLLVAWAGRGLEGRERRAVVGFVSVALLVRLLAVALFFLTIDHAQRPWGLMVGDEKLIQQRSLWLRNIAFGIPIAPSDWVESYQGYGESGLLYVFAYVHALIGHAPYAAHLLNILLFVTGAVVLHKILRPAYGAMPAFGALGLILVVPTLFFWSISALKEPANFFLTTVVLASIVVAVKARLLILRGLALVVAILALNAVTAIRPVGWMLVTGGFGAGVAAMIATRRSWLFLLCAAALGLAVAQGIQRPDVQAQILRQFRIAAVSHIGNVTTPGYAYKLLDWHFYTRWRIENTLDFMSLEESSRYAVRAAASFLTVPFPWQMASRSALAFLPELLLWYAAIPLALVGFAAGLRRDPWVTFLLAGYSVIGGMIISLPSGNIGTLIRMRDMVVPFVLCLSALGGCVVLEHVGRRLAGARSLERQLDRRPEELHAIAR